MTRFDYETFRAEVLRLIEVEGLRPLSRRLDFPISKLRSVAAGRDMHASTMVSLCQAFGFELRFGPQQQLDEVEDEPGVYTRIQLTEAELSAGPGADNAGEAVVDHLLFRRDWLRRIGVRPENARLARARGDSMMPMIWDGDLVMVDISLREVPQKVGATGHPKASLFALVQNGEARIKWAQRTKNALTIYSENTASFRPEIYSGIELEELTIVGQVVWWGHTVRE